MYEPGKRFILHFFFSTTVKETLISTLTDYYIHPTTAVTDGEEVNMFPRLPPSPSQSLFETNNNNNSDTWFMRKHSVASDGQDFLTPPLTSWRRGSAPPDKLCSRCAACFAKQLPCGHAICSSCRLSSSQHCPVCVPSLDSKLMPSSHPNMTRSLLTPPPHYPCAKMSNVSSYACSIIIMIIILICR